MKIFFDIKALKSSEKCRKFSKSVSYETLIDGTATTGTNIKQTQKMFLDNEVKPLTAVGTLTSLLCNSDKVVEKLLQRLLIFRLAKIISLVAVLSINMVGESQAIEIPTGGVSGTCNSAGTCLWNLDENGKMTISAAEGAKNVRMGDYHCNSDNCVSGGGDRPWENYLQDIKNVVVGGNITYIGNDAFQSAHNLETVTGMKDVTTIGGSSVFAYTGLTGFTIPDSLTNMSSSIFSYSKVLTELIIPDNLIDSGVLLSDSMFRNSCFFSAYASTIPSCADAKIVCQGDIEKCKTALAKFGGNGNCTVDYCIDANKIVAANYQQCSGNYFWNGAKCEREPDLSKRKCCDSCKDMGGWCNRIRYTPAEAAPLLHNDNTNEVTITFRK